jgi:hypothetical protein
VTPARESLTHENRLAQGLLWVGVAVAIAAAVVGVVLVVRRRRRYPVVVGPTPYPRFPGPPAGAPWQPGYGPSFPPPVQHPMPAPGPPHHPFPAAGGPPHPAER